LNPEGEYFKDATGNRRYWPVYTRNINVEGIEDVRDQLFAEALVRWRAGESLYLDTKETNIQAHEEQTHRLIKDDWAETIENWLERNEYDRKVFATTALDIFVRAVKGEARWMKQPEQRRIAAIMRTLGWRSSPFYDREAKKTRRGYIRPGYELDKDILAEQPIEVAK
jgi:putative DNA primase/helicase